MNRHSDFRNPPSIPKDIRATIRRVGGTNPYGEPLFRLCLAEDRITKAAGEWTIWGDDVPLDDRGGLGVSQVQAMLNQYHEIMEVAMLTGKSQHDLDELEKKLAPALDEHIQSVMKMAAPLRVDTGMAEVPIYPFDGYILEKWKPAENWGSPADWEQYKFQGECALGPYPVYGEYELIAGPTPYLPTSEQLEDAIRRHFREVNAKPKSPRERVIMMMAKREQHQKALAKERRNMAESFHKDIGVLMNRVSLGAGRVRQELAEKAGLEGHFGN